ncbi:MAG: phosphonate ABC transporter ATP-binding protein [Anaerolineales bacterium]|nr:phosphonate ABC transporter ATP-binding protein [Anaerolineales bacterium]MCB9127794.1 phosphonate ABC transporter ATP-binding protein [Ardenticatenales bacterium]
MLEVINVSKVYDDGTRALNNVSFTVEDGEFLVLIGLSGSGKSTMLRCINRLIDPTEGRILYNGQDITNADPRELRQIRRQIGMVFQHFNLVKRSSVLRNVLSGRLGYTNTLSSVLGLWSAEDKQKAMENLRLVGIENKANNRADELSGGQQQRVGIARAMMQEPTLMLADEPVASLDPALADSVMRYFEKLNQERGTSVICSLHVLGLARRYATRIIALKAGEVVYNGDPDLIDDVRFREIYGDEAVEHSLR